MKKQLSIQKKSEDLRNEVSLEWLVGNTAIRESTTSPIDELMLDGETIDLLKSGRFLLCEIIKHPDFIKLMTDTEIYVDGIATMQIKNMNDWPDAVRLQIIRQKIRMPTTKKSVIPFVHFANRNL